MTLSLKYKIGELITRIWLNSIEIVDRLLIILGACGTQVMNNLSEQAGAQPKLLYQCEKLDSNESLIDDLIAKLKYPRMLITFEQLRGWALGERAKKNNDKSEPESSKWDLFVCSVCWCELIRLFSTHSARVRELSSNFARAITQFKLRINIREVLASQRAWRTSFFSLEVLLSRRGLDFDYFPLS